MYLDKIFQENVVSVNRLIYRQTFLTLQSISASCVRGAEDLPPTCCAVPVWARRWFWLPALLGACWAASALPKGLCGSSPAHHLVGFGEPVSSKEHLRAGGDNVVVKGGCDREKDG